MLRRLTFSPLLSARSATADARLTTKQFEGEVHSTITVTLGPSGGTAPPPPIT